MPLVCFSQSFNEEFMLDWLDAVHQKVDQLVVLLVRVVLRSRDVCALLVTQSSRPHQQIHQTVLTLQISS